MTRPRPDVNSSDALSNEKPIKRPYVLKQRAQKQIETRRRIIEATTELHLTVGPAATHLTEVARRAGVQRVTIYNHFPDETALFAACSADWRALHPTPDPQHWLATADAGARLRLALGELYEWYRETAPMTANVLRDAQVLPALQRVLERGLLRYLDAIPETLAEPFGARGRRRERVLHAARAAVDFHFWRALAPIGDDDAAELGAGLVELAAYGSKTDR
jgi:AcrR family transcriptional regulator